jgi:uncharacterized iron-regulated membrane protein
MSLTLEHEQPLAADTHLPKNASLATRFYRAVWRWHFYAGLFVVPFMVILALSGMVYLFKPQLDALMYPLHVAPAGTALPADAQLQAALAAYPGASASSFAPAAAADRSAMVTLTTAAGQRLAVFVNPYTGAVLGSRDEENNLQALAVRVHGELLIGPVGDYLVELAACWALVLVLSGLYLWWPRKGSRIWGVLLPRLFTKNKRIFWRDLHAVPGFWGALLIVFLIISGLPWATFWGTNFARVWNQYPAQMWDDVPLSDKNAATLNSDTNQVVPWAAEDTPLPESTPPASHDHHDGTAGSGPGAGAVTLESVVAHAKAMALPPGYSISLPDGEAGVYTVSIAANDPRQSRTIHIDQYSGAMLADIGWHQYGPVPRAVELGIALHEGRFFGPLNQALMFLAAVITLILPITGAIMWWRRRPAGRLGAPARPTELPMRWGALALIIGLAIAFPLVGISLTIVVLLDLLVISRLPLLRRVVG